MKSYKEIHQLLAKEIAELEFGHNPENLYEPIRYILSLGGKRLRPTLALLSHQLHSTDIKNAVLPVLAVEVFHNFTLMHDDIMDEAPLRRGQPTVHEKWDQTVAILSGDTMMVKAYDLLLKADTKKIPTIIERFNKTATEVCEGQQIDMNFESRQDVSVGEYIEMIRLKTAVLIGYSLELGGILAGYDDDSVQTLYKMGEDLGIGFQLMDDYLDVYGDQSKFGKQVGGDIISNKKTFLLITALEKSNRQQKNELLTWLEKTSFDPDEKVSVVRRIYNEIGIAELTKSKMNEYFNECFSYLDDLDANPSSKFLLKEFIDRIINRES